MKLKDVAEPTGLEAAMMNDFSRFLEKYANDINDVTNYILTHIAYGYAIKYDKETFLELCTICFDQVYSVLEEVRKQPQGEEYLKYLKEGKKGC